MEEKEIKQRLQCDIPEDSCKEAIKAIEARLAAGAEVFMFLKGRIDLHSQEFDHLWEWKRNQNGDLKRILEKLGMLDKEGVTNLLAQSEKLNERFAKQLQAQKKEIEELVRPVCEAVEMLQKGANAKDTVKEFKGKVAESSLKYLTGGTALILAFWKIFDLVKSAMAAKGN